MARFSLERSMQTGSVGLGKKCSGACSFWMGAFGSDMVEGLPIGSAHLAQPIATQICFNKTSTPASNQIQLTRNLPLVYDGTVFGTFIVRGRGV